MTRLWVPARAIDARVGWSGRDSACTKAPGSSPAALGAEAWPRPRPRAPHPCHSRHSGAQGELEAGRAARRASGLARGTCLTLEAP